MTLPPIPQTDPRAGYLAHKAEIDAAIRRVLDGGWYILGDEVRAFETEFAAFVGTAHAVGVANGTDALEIGLRALGVGPGDGVVTVSHTAVATVAAIELVGATPILVDIDPADFNMAPDDLAAVLANTTLRIKAVIPVHLYGHPAPMAEIARLAAKVGAGVLEDCSQAHGAAIDGHQVGRFGAIAAYSLYPTKNLGALGDGGVLVTEDAALAGTLRALREYGWRQRYISDSPGLNSRLDELQAAILRVKLGTLMAENARRQAIAAAYDAGLARTPYRTPAAGPGVSHVYHQYVVRTPERERVREHLKAQGIATNVHYPLPVHLQPAYRGRVPIGPAGLAETEAIQGEIMSLPIYPQMTDAATARVIAALREAMPG
ncbi:MAG: DegT/DnrJ/EryC1/StrS family aminotransferase [Alphaproteobacteria bacterium]|nr:DegT/DnrJ/EryC1/StrS family aminotransferase [Alphaproteobacteria bacterium]